MTRRPTRLALTLATVLASVGFLPAAAHAQTVLVPGLTPTATSTSRARVGKAAALPTTSFVVTAAPGTRIPGATPLAADGSQYRVIVPATAANAAASVLDRATAVSAVEPDSTLHWSDFGAVGAPNDPMAAGEWALDAIGWNHVVAPASTPLIAFLDSGIDASSPEFAGTLPDGQPKIQSTWNAIDGSTAAADDLGHGTGTASIAAGLTGNGIGIASVAPGSPIMEIKVGGLAGVELSDAVGGINHAVAGGAKVINMSFGSPEYSAALAAAVQNAVSHGVVVVAAAGNDGCAADGGGNETDYPAALPHVIAVAASSQSRSIACFSNYGPEVALAAPGVDLTLATVVGSAPDTLQDPSGYETGSGTSFSAPIVSGAVALLLAEHPTWTPGQVRFALMATATDIGPKGWDPHAGSGILDLPALLAYAGPLPQDSAEANDDVAQARLLAPFLGATRSAAVRGTVDVEDDPSDVYPVTLRAGQHLRLTLHAASPLTLTLWKPGTRTVRAAASRRGALQVGTSATGKLTVTAPASGTYWIQVGAARGTNVAYTLGAGAR